MTNHRSLGMDARITRRDFLDAALVASAGLLMRGVAPADVLDPRAAAFDGYGGVGDYAGANGNTWAVIQEGHRLRDRKFATLRVSDVRPDETVDTVIVGGGISGLAAALFLQRTSHPRQCLVLDDHPIFGGLAKSNEIVVGGERLVGNQASALFFPPLPGSFLAEFYPSIRDRSRPLRLSDVERIRSRAPGGPHLLSEAADEDRRSTSAKPSDGRRARSWSIPSDVNSRARR